MKMLKTLTLLAAFAASSSVMADTIGGSISFGGTSFSTDNDANFAASTKFTAFTGLHVEATSGDYSGIVPPTDTPIVFALLQYAPAGSETATPVTVWSFTEGGLNYSFTLTSFSKTFANQNSLILDGTGIAHIDGFTDTYGTWNFAGGSTGPTEFHFSAGTTVPDGGATAILLGVGLLGLGALRRKA